MSIRNLEKFTKTIIDGMYRHYNYRIEYFGFLKGEVSSWGLSKSLEDGSREILVFLNIEELTSRDYEVELCSRINCSRERLTKVILIGEKTEEALIQDQLAYLTDCSEAINKFIIINLLNKSLQVSNGSVEFQARQIASIMDSQIKARSNREKAAITYSLMAVNILIFLFTAYLSGSFIDININVLVALGAKYNRAIENGQWYRLFTSMFLHGGLIHLAANMYSLYSIGPLVENLYDRAKFIMIYIFSGLVAAFFSFWFSNAVSVGASGAIFGILGVLLVFSLKERKRLGKDFFISIASSVAVNLYIGLTLPNIDNYAHLGGLIGGAVLGLLLSHNKKP
jgi:rhomboid protease GluP